MKINKWMTLALMLGFCLAVYVSIYLTQPALNNPG